MMQCQTIFLLTLVSCSIPASLGVEAQYAPVCVVLFQYHGTKYRLTTDTFMHKVTAEFNLSENVISLC